MLAPSDPVNYMFSMTPGMIPGTGLNDASQGALEGIAACSENNKVCTQAILRALQTLCVPPSACLSVSSDSPSANYPGNGSYASSNARFAPSVLAQGQFPFAAQSRKIDDVLTTNRGVIELVSKVLLCSCSATPSIQLLLVTICDRLVAWYRAMLRANHCENMKRGPGPACAGPDDDPSEQIVPQPITMGDFAVDPAMSLRIRDQLVVEEVRRVETVIRQFAARVQETRGQNPCVQAQKIYDILNRLLGEQLQAQASMSQHQAGV
ncbi:hypothetical protein N7492_000236 [Penicillium capsulatum]|uniref:Aflatoxin regulatory protein domain-containing protein n=1 Tax=Penicillium capsulatum TaxID=69766 RepID=A0A9W9LYT4_9EURO|nr:hypothetical protein N7492_000236 [Penicillium capsulatum]KAJ6130698.1 hypothetical protein N7512_003478 [Penicillium capsulatum]